MSELVKYVQEHTIRGECQCGLCADKGDAPEPTGHTADMIFFKVAMVGVHKIPDMWEELKKLTTDHVGAFADCNPFDGAEHNYQELGAWIGDQGLAMQYMGLGVLLGLFDLMTPITMLFPTDPALSEANNTPEETRENETMRALIMQMAQAGLVAVKARVVN